jgi:tetratricopeptide (TPR) repeat protein
MGYDVHITRKENWWDDSGPEISLDEWIAVVTGDKDMRLDGYAEAQLGNGSALRYERDGLSVWTAYSGHGKDGNMAWFDLRRGCVIVKNPDPEILQKMWSLAQVLSAKVQGDGGEFYDTSGMRIDNKRGPYDSERELDRVIAKHDAAAKEADYYSDRALTYGREGKLDRAIADFNEAIRLRPDADTYYNRGFAYYSKGELDRAIADYDEAIRLDPKHALAYNNRGSTYASKGELDCAIADYDEAIRLNPKNALAYYGRGVAYYSKGQLDRAIADYDEAIRLDLKDADTYYNRGRAHFSKGDYAGAIADYDQALRFDLNEPGLTEVRQNRERAQNAIATPPE